MADSKTQNMLLRKISNQKWSGLQNLHGKRKVFACGEYKMEVLLKVVELVELVEALPFRLVVVLS